MRLRALVLPAILLGTALCSGSAQAEQCVTEHPEVYGNSHELCLVTDTSQPLLTPATVQFRVAPEATSFQVIGGGNSRLVAAGGEGSRSLWETVIPPVDADQTLQLTAYANAPCNPPPPEPRGVPCETSWGEGTFSLPVLAPSLNERLTIAKAKGGVTATFRYESRRTLNVVIRLWLSPSRSQRPTLTRRRVARTTGVGQQSVAATLPRAVLERKCKGYPRCWVFALAESQVPMQTFVGPPTQVQTSRVIESKRVR